ncbi:MAG TPA: uracil-DNA glycosylase [Woeseiaceae bacterium]|nr:uracil-DNA glycosylase [Woeseiaceae bacterium]
MRTIMRADPERLAYLEALGIDVYFLRRQGEGAVEASIDSGALRAGGEAPAPAAEAMTEVPLLDWPELRNAVSVCTRCRLHESRTQTVFGVGSREADWMIVGEAPGAEEDRRGEPFVGRAGQLLDQMLRAVGLGRDRVFIANILKCRPPGNRDPAAEEAAACRGWLDRQIALLSPRLILAVGRIAAQQLLESQAPLGRLRGQVHRLKNTEIPVIVTYHPAYLLREPRQKRKAWADLCLARREAAARST